MTVVSKRPLITWVGSKYLESKLLVPLVRERLRGGNLIEPFAGSAAIFFALRPETAILGDALRVLIDTYQAIRDTPDEVIATLGRFIALGSDRDAFEAMRVYESQNAVQSAGRMLYLNQTAFNGLWRTNSKGDFNAGWAKKKNPSYATPEMIRDASAALQAAALYAGDWRLGVQRAGLGDVIFADPPYPGSNARYAGRAKKVDHADLVEELVAAVGRGAGVVATEPESDELAALFAPHFDGIPFSRFSGLSGASSGRGSMNQVAWVSKL